MARKSRAIGFNGIVKLVSNLDEIDERANRQKNKNSHRQYTQVHTQPVEKAEKTNEQVGRQKSFINLDPIDVLSNGSMAAPWSSIDEGETYILGKLMITVQREPALVIQMLSDLKGHKRQPHPLKYLLAMSVFYKGSVVPVMSIGVEKSAASESLFLGIFLENQRLNLGDIKILNERTLKDQMFSVIKECTGEEGFPLKIGNIKDAFARTETGLIGQSLIFHDATGESYKKKSWWKFGG